MRSFFMPLLWAARAHHGFVLYRCCGRKNDVAIRDLGQLRDSAAIMVAMRRWLCIFFLAGFMAAGLPVRADGEAYQLHLGFIIVGLVCDDTSVVRVEDGGDHLRLVGLAPGRTKCGFWSNPKSPAPSKVYEVVVTRAPPKLQPSRVNP
jgi:hypothetical protein